MHARELQKERHIYCGKLHNATEKLKKEWDGQEAVVSHMQLLFQQQMEQNTLKMQKEYTTNEEKQEKKFAKSFLKMQQEYTKNEEKQETKFTKFVSKMTEENSNEKEKMQRQLDRKDMKMMADRVTNDER